jgi:hypothetical protein
MNHLQAALLADRLGDRVIELVAGEGGGVEPYAALLGLAIAGLRLKGVSEVTVSKMVTGCLLNVARDVENVR